MKRNIFKHLGGVVFSLLKVSDDIPERDVGAHDTSKKTKKKDNNILDQDPFVATQIAPIGSGINNGWCHDAQGGHFDCTKERDHQFQPGYGGGQGKGDNVKDNSGQVVHG